MRFHLASADRARSAAKTLRKNLSQYGIEASLGACQAAIAAALGYASWAELKSQAGRQPPSPFDHEVEEGLRGARLEHQALALCEAFKLARPASRSLVEGLGLTASRIAEGAPPPRYALPVADFLVFCSARADRHDGGISVIAVMPYRDGLAFRLEALFGPDEPYPAIAFGCWPLAEEHARDSAPRLKAVRDGSDNAWRISSQVLGFFPGDEEREFLSTALRAFKCMDVTDVELDQAVHAWRRLLRDAGVRALDARLDRSALALFEAASAPPTSAPEAYAALRDAPANARMRSLLAELPMFARELWLDSAIRDPQGPSTPEALIEHVADVGLSCGTLGATGPIPRKLIESFRGETGGVAAWTPVSLVATLGLAQWRGEDSWRWWAGERLKAYIALALTFRRLQLLWREGSILAYIGRDRIDMLLDGPPWRVTDACRAVLDQPDLDKIPGEISTALARAAILMSGCRSSTGSSPRIDPARHGAALLDLLDAGSLDKVLSKAMMVIARASLGKNVELSASPAA